MKSHFPMRRMGKFKIGAGTAKNSSKQGAQNDSHQKGEKSLQNLQNTEINNLFTQLFTHIYIN